MSTPEVHDMDETFLSAYLDDELDVPTRAAVQARIDGSPAWEAELVEVRAARDAGRALPLVDARPGFWDHVLDGNDHDTKGGNVVDLGVARQRRAWVSRWRAVAGAAAAAVVLGVVLVPRPAPVDPALGTLTQVHAERASLGNDVVSNLAGAVVPAGLDR